MSGRGGATTGGGTTGTGISGVEETGRFKTSFSNSLSPDCNETGVTGGGVLGALGGTTAGGFGRMVFCPNAAGPLARIIGMSYSTGGTTGGATGGVTGGGTTGGTTGGGTTGGGTTGGGTTGGGTTGGGATGIFELTCPGKAAVGPV